VAAADRHLDGAFGALLTFDVGEVLCVAAFASDQFGEFDPEGGQLQVPERKSIASRRWCTG
jgi:hypothetical protein